MPKTMHRLLMEAKIAKVLKETYGGVPDNDRCETSGGRVAYPTTVWYEIDGEVYILPPDQHDVRFNIIVLDLTRYESMFRSGVILDPVHTGRTIKEVVDNRRAPSG